MPTSSRIIADSVGPHGVRLTTYEVTFPRFILAEVNTHRMLSRNSASSRAIPTEKIIQRVVDDPFIPEFAGRVKGMGVGEALAGDEARRARQGWLEARDKSVEVAHTLLHVDKSRVNRLLEPWMWHTALISATDWENFFRLRNHAAAQPEFQYLACKMEIDYLSHEPEALDWGEWHLPLATDFVPSPEPTEDAEVSAGRCAKVSYDTHNADETPKESRKRWRALTENGHWSPGEHPARVPMEDEWADRLNYFQGYWGNYFGWKQLRKHYEGESVFNG